MSQEALALIVVSVLGAKLGLAAWLFAHRCDQLNKENAELRKLLKPYVT
jgi:hypothetical protein